MEEIIVIRARDPDGSVFKAVRGALKGKRAEVVDVAAPATSVLRIGELELNHKHRRVLMADREVELNHGEYAMLYCMASSPGQVFSKAQLYEAAWGGGISKRDKLRGEYHLAAEKKTGGGPQASGVHQNSGGDRVSSGLSALKKRGEAIVNLLLVISKNE